MKKKAIPFARQLPALEKSLAKAGFKVSVIEKSKDFVSYLAQGLNFKHNFIQVVSITLKNAEFAVVELFVSNLTVTEKWAEIDISIDVLSDYLTHMLSLSAKELSKVVKGDKELDGIVDQIDKKEPQLALWVKDLHHLEDEYLAKKGSPAQVAKLQTKLAQLENKCLKEEIEISRLSFRYFTNTLDPVDSFFYDALFTTNWAEKKKTRKKA